MWWLTTLEGITSDYVDFTVGVLGNKIHYDHTGFALLPIGYWQWLLNEELDLSNILILAWSPLIFITPE